MNHLIRTMALVMGTLGLFLAASSQICTDPSACNYDPDASTSPVACLKLDTVAVHTDGILAGQTTYRIYFQSATPNDFVTAVFGNDSIPLSLTTTTSFYQHPVGGASAQSINPLLVPNFPELVHDSYVTIGLSQAAVAGDGENAPSLLASPNQDWISTFEPGFGAPGSSFVIDDMIGGIWFIYNGDANGYPDAQGRVLLAQLTTDGEIGGSLNVQYFPNGGSAISETFHLDELCVPPAEGDCTYAEPNEDCDGACLNDTDSDGICDEVDDCVGALDECGVCNGSGATADCGCADIPEGDCDCNGNQIDALGVCGGNCPADEDGDGICDNYEGSGCGDPAACNFDPFAEPVDDTPITDYCLHTEVVAIHSTGALAGMTTYRVSIQTLYPTDFVTSVSGNAQHPTRIETTTSFYQDVLGGVTPENVNPLLISAFYVWAYDSWVTIGV